MVSAPNLKQLESGEVHVWFARLARGESDVRLADCDFLLSTAECRRAARFRFPEHSREFRISHALVRACLSAYVPAVVPRRWTFIENEHGRPDIDPALGAPPLSFNLSHTRGLAACAVAMATPVGVDVEWTQRKSTLVEIADRFFAAAEVEELRSLPQERQEPRFFDYWTLKEAYIKAQGKGLAIPLGKFAYRLDDVAPPTIRIDPSLEDDPALWRFALWSPTPEHRAAVAVRGGSRASLALVRFLAVPPGRVERVESSLTTPARDT